MLRVNRRTDGRTGREEEKGRDGRRVCKRERERDRERGRRVAHTTMYETQSLAFKSPLARISRETTRHGTSRTRVALRLSPVSFHPRISATTSNAIRRRKRNCSRRVLAHSLTTPDGGHYGNESP